MIDQLGLLPLVKAVALAFAAGAGLLLVLSFLPASRASARQLWLLLGSEAIILAGGVLPWLFPRAAILAWLLIGAGRIGYESGAIYGLIARRPLSWAAALALTLAAMLGWFISRDGLLGMMLCIAAAALVAYLTRNRLPLAGALAPFVVFPLLPVMAFAHAAAQPRLAPVLVLSLLLVEVFDSFSLLGGRLYGRTPLIPRLSPKKTWEGLATGAAALFTASMVIASTLGISKFEMLVAAIVILLSALAGDLLGSRAKRRAGVKDYPPVMAVQGGLLDIADSWIVAAPCLAALMTAF